MVLKSVLILLFVFIMKQGNASSHIYYRERTGALPREGSSCPRRRAALLKAGYIYTHVCVHVCMRSFSPTSGSTLDSHHHSLYMKVVTFIILQEFLHAYESKY